MQGPIPIESRALGTLAYIRRSIESSGSMAVPGTAGFVMGVIGIFASVVASLPRWAHLWLQIWLVAAAVALVVGGAMMAREAAQSGHARYLGPVRKFLMCLCPALLAGAANARTPSNMNNTPMKQMSRMVRGIVTVLADSTAHP